MFRTIRIIVLFMSTKGDHKNKNHVDQQVYLIFSDTPPRYYPIEMGTGEKDEPSPRTRRTKRKARHTHGYQRYKRWQIHG